jgi:hypothetical protein
MCATAVSCRQKPGDSDGRTLLPINRPDRPDIDRIRTGYRPDKIAPKISVSATPSRITEGMLWLAQQKISPFRSVLRLRDILSILTPHSQRRIVASLTGEPNQSQPRSLVSAADKWLRVLHRSAEDPSNLLQVMLAKGKFISSLPAFPGAVAQIRINRINL